MQFNNYNIDLQTICNLINILTSFHSFSIIYNNFNNENDDDDENNKEEKYKQQ